MKIHFFNPEKYELITSFEMIAFFTGCKPKEKIENVKYFSCTLLIKAQLVTGRNYFLCEDLPADFHLHRAFFCKYYNQYGDADLQKNQQHQGPNL